MQTALRSRGEQSHASLAQSSLRSFSAMIVVASACLIPQARAGVGLTAKAGTLGVGADVSVTIAPRLNLRVGAQAGTITIDNIHERAVADEISDITDLDADLHLESYSLLLDLHPFDSAFRVTAGVLVNENKFSVTASTGDVLDIGNNDYSVAYLNGSMTFQEVGGYLGIGVGNAAGQDGRWHFAMDAGILYQGGPEVSLSGSTSDPVLDALLAVDLALEEADIQDDLSALRFYPVLSFGVSYAF